MFTDTRRAPPNTEWITGRYTPAGAIDWGGTALGVTRVALAGAAAGAVLGVVLGGSVPKYAVVGAVAAPLVVMAVVPNV